MRDKRLHEMRSSDPYRPTGKPRDPGHCPVCGAVHVHGRWQWPDPATRAGGGEMMCPACRRIAEANPAGLLHIAGPFAREHRDEIMALCRHEESQESGEHPLHRIMLIEEDADGVTLSTTDTHLPERLGHALHRAYKGEVDYHHHADGSMVRVEWRR